MKKWNKIMSLVLIVVMFVGMMPNTISLTKASNNEAAGNTAASYQINEVSSKLQEEGLVWLDASDSTNPLALHGLDPQDGAKYARMDLETAEAIAGSTTFSKTSVYSHARESAGGRIRFTTTSPYIAIQAEFPLYVSDYASGMKAGKYGFDVYVENTETGSYEYYGTIEPSTLPSSNKAWKYEDILKFEDESPKNVMIYLPIANELSEVYVGLKDTSYVVDSETKYEKKAPIVYYGSSITQGGMSTKPGNTYVNTIGRKLNYDYINLGVWGSCKAESAFANYIASLEMSAFVFDYDHNESTASVLANKHYAFYEIVRAAHPSIPIIFVTRPDSQESGLHLETKAVIKASYDNAVAAGDKNVYYIDGATFFEYDASYLSDGVHPTDAGQARMAEVIGNTLVGLLEVNTANYNERVMLYDTFDAGTEWKTTDHNWRVDDAQYAGSRTGVAELGYNNIQSRNLYNNSQMADVHVESDVCVKEAMNQGDKTQYHMIAARGGADVSGGIAFGFKTALGAEKMSLVVALYTKNQNPLTTVYCETSAIYTFNTVYKLDLFVVGNTVIAKCDGKVIFASEVDGLPAKGYCGIFDMRASLSATSRKAGYFDNVKVSTITYDSYKVKGAIVCDPNGTGFADIVPVSGDVSIASMEDRQVTISGFSNKIPGKYVGPVDITYDGKTWTTAIDQEVYVVSNLSNAVTSMNDSHWHQLNSAGCVNGKGTWTLTNNNGTSIDGSGKVTLAANLTNYLAMNTVTNKKSSPYSDFYVEYNLTIKEAAGQVASNAHFDTRYITAENSNSTDGSIARVTYNNGKLTANMVRAAGSYSYTNTALSQGLAVGNSMKISLMVTDGVVKYYVNDTLVGTMTMGTTEGWFVLKNNSPTIAIAEIDDFLFVPVPEKQVADIKVGCVSKVQKGTTLSPTVIPVYNWPHSEGTVVTEGVSVTGFDNTKLGVQEVTISYSGISKKAKVEVVDYEIQHAEDFLDYNASEWSAASPALVAENGKLIMQATSGELALYGNEQKDGYMEATFTVASSEALESGTATTVYPLSLIYRQKGAASKTTIETRLKCLKDSSGNIVGSLECLVRTSNSAGTVSATKIQGFKFGKQYTIKLACIGNYFEVTLNDQVYYQKTIAKNHALATNSDIRFYISNAANSGIVEVDNLVIADYETYTISDSDTITLPTIAAANTAEGSYEKTSYLAKETVEVTVNPGEGKQLKVGGLYYTESGSDTKYSVSKRAAEAGQKQEVSNTFLLNMPAKDITLVDEYYTLGSQDANIGINGVSIREASEDVKAALRFTSRVYKAYNDGTTEYTLKEVGTLLFKQANGETSVDVTALNACYASENGTYSVGGAMYGKKVKATKVQDLCNEFVDYGLYLTYESGTSLGNQNYIVYTYAVYEDAEGNSIVKFGVTPVMYSYNSVAAKLGYEGL